MSSKSWQLHVRGVASLALMFAMTSFCGCGTSDEDAIPTASVSGNVTLDGQPLDAATIRFVPIEPTPGGKTSVGIVQGAFSLPAELGPAVGKHRVEIESNDDGGFAPDDEEAARRLQESGVKRIEVVKIPPVYNSQSNLTADVTDEGPNEYVFQLQSKPGK